MELRRSDLDPDPLAQFAAWFARRARPASPFPRRWRSRRRRPTARPSVRMVLLKGFDERGFVFFTSYGSRKGRELAANPRAALLFHWQPLGRQVRIEGAVSRGSGRGVGRVLPLAPARQPALGDRLATSRSRSPRAPSSRPGSPRSRATATRRGPAELGRLRARARRVRVLAAPRRPPPRPLPLRARRRRLADRAPPALTAVSRGQAPGHAPQRGAARIGRSDPSLCS